MKRLSAKQTPSVPIRDCKSCKDHFSTLKFRNARVEHKKRTKNGTIDDLMNG